ncbi:MAG: ferritin-like domain-containing protein [Cyanobacteria bacterium J06555_13]
MIQAINQPGASFDLAGSWQTGMETRALQQRMTALIQQYLSLEHLSDRINDLPSQFDHPQVRPWQKISWQDISPQQVVGIELKVFLKILIGAINTETPIRDYTQASRQYLEAIHPPMAKFVGGSIAPDGRLQEPGLWEKEERQHTPALSRIYTQLAGEKPLATPHNARPFQAVTDPRAALYRHGVHRVATEYGATCLYLWMMAHTTGALQQVLQELLIDEVNHMTKFWGFGCWAYPEASVVQTGWMLLKSSGGKVGYRRDRSHLFGTLHRMRETLAWSDWSGSNRRTFVVTCWQVLQQMRAWLKTLKRQNLENLLQAESHTSCTNVA